MKLLLIACFYISIGSLFFQSSNAALDVANEVSSEEYDRPPERMMCTFVMF